MTKVTPPKIFTRNKILGLRYAIDGVDKKKSLKMKDTPQNRKLVETQVIPQFILKVHSGEFFENNNVKIPTIDEYVKVSFELHKGSRCESTIYGYKKNYKKYIEPTFGEKRLDTIKGSHITLWQNQLQEKEKLSKSSIMKIRTTLHTLFEDAIEEEIINSNPVKKAKPLKNTKETKVKRTPLEPFKKTEIKSILDCADGQSKNLLATLFYTGTRAGECIGLKWENVDFQKNTITIRQQVVNGIEKSILKTTNSRRTIPIISSLLPYLKKQYSLTGHKNSFVFLTEKTNKHYHSAGKVREQIWTKTLKKANIKYRNLHQTRGTFISTLISSGEDINFVSKIAGHENVRITLERYSEYIPVKNKDFGNCFN